MDAVEKVFVQVDIDTGEVVRDKNGHCIPVKHGMF
jgi:hypothetical protein